MYSFLNSTEHAGQLVLLSDTLTDGSFLVHHFVSQALKDGHHTVLISLAQSLLHYSSVCSKLGVNLHKKREEGLFCFVDGVSHLLSKVFTTAVSPGDGASAAASGKEPTIVLDSDGSLVGASALLQELMSAQNREKPTCLIIDSLSILLNVGVTLGEVVMFVQACYHTLTSNPGSASYLVVMVHREEGEEGEPEDLLHKHLLHISHLHLQAKGLGTGYCRDVHGELSAIWRDPACTGTDLPHQQTTHYKLIDKSVQLFAKGTSKAIL